MAISSSASGLRPGVCTSTTRPTTPYTGQIIYETDTGYLRVWDGSAWDYLSQKQDTTTNLPISDIGGAWTSWTPTLTASTTNPTLGTGSDASGRYAQINKSVFFYATFTFGTGAAAGTGSYQISLPITAKNALNVVGSGWLYDSSANRLETCVVRLGATTYAWCYQTATSTYQTQAAQPWTWAQGDVITIFGTYEAA